MRELPSKRDAKYPHLLDGLEFCYVPGLRGGMSTGLVRDFSVNQRHGVMYGGMAPTQLSSIGPHGPQLGTGASNIGHWEYTFDGESPCSVANEITMFSWNSLPVTAQGMIDHSVDATATNTGVSLFEYTANRLYSTVLAGGRTIVQGQILWTHGAIPIGPYGFGTVYSSRLGQFIYADGIVRVADSSHTGDFNSALTHFEFAATTNSVTYEMHGPLFCSCVWSRALNAADMALLNAKPLALFETRRIIVPIPTVVTRQRYVAADAAGGGSGTSSSDPWTIVEMAANLEAGQIANIKSGTYTLAANLTMSNSGTKSSPIILRGYNSSIGDLWPPTFSAGRLVTTNYPTIDPVGYVFQVGNYTITESLLVAKTTATGTDSSLNIGDYNLAVGLAGTSTDTDSRGVIGNTGGPGATFVGVDTDESVSIRVEYILEDNSNMVCSVRLGIGEGQLDVGSTAVHTLMGNAGVDNFYLRGGAGIFFCTSVAPDDSGILQGSADAFAQIIGCMITDCGDYAFERLTSAGGMLIAFNRTRDNGSGTSVNLGDWPSLYEETTDGGTWTTDYTDPASDDFRTISTSPAIDHAQCPNLDAGWLSE